MRTLTPSVTVGICTRNRPDQVLRPVSAVLGGTHSDVQLVVVDQSDDDSSQNALAPFLEDPRLRYIRSGETGVANARNAVLRALDGDLLLFTDDDCEPSPDWVAGMVAHASSQQGAFAIFGPLVPPPGLEVDGIVPAFEPASERFIRSGRKPFLGGVTANVALSREAIAKVGPFNAELGRGTALQGGEDYEYVLRLMHLGGTVGIVTAPAVVHHRVVPLNEIRGWLRSDLRAAGTLLAWETRKRNWVAPPQMLFFFSREFGNAVRRALTGKRPFGFSRAAWLAQGFAAGLVGASRGRHHRLTVADPLKDAPRTGD